VKSPIGAGEVLSAAEIPAEFQAISRQAKILLDEMLDALLDVLLDLAAMARFFLISPARRDRHL
jgi:hypothetical protein